MNAKIRMLTRTAVLAALSALLYFLPGIPVIPPFYKLDFSALPAFAAGVAIGPWQALAVLLVKDLTGLLHSSSMGVGEIADFVACAALVLPAALLTRRAWSEKRMWLGAGLGALLMTIAGSLLNYFLILPFYANLYGMEMSDLVGMIQKTIPAVTDPVRLAAFAAAPFNLLKGAVISVLTCLIVGRLAGYLRLNERTIS